MNARYCKARYLKRGDQIIGIETDTFAYPKTIVDGYLDGGTIAGNDETFHGWFVDGTPFEIPADDGAYVLDLTTATTAERATLTALTDSDFAELGL